MFDKTTHFSYRSSRLTSWRKGDLAVASAWKADYHKLLRHVGKAVQDRPQMATKAYLKLLGAFPSQIPSTVRMQIHIAKGPLEAGALLGELTVEQTYGRYHGSGIHSFRAFPEISYTVGGKVHEFVRPFLRRWRSGPLEVPWQVTYQTIPTVRELIGPLGDHLWSVVPTAYATAFLANGLKLTNPQKEAALYLDVVRNCHTVYHSWSGAWAVIVRAPKTALVDEYGILNATSGPALEWEGDLKLYFRRGVHIPTERMEQGVTLEHIQAERNLEVRSILIELYGEEKYLFEAGFMRVAQDERGELFRGDTSSGRESYVKVKNATPEKDGSFRTFFIRVPSTVSTPTEAVAWTFQRRGDGYQPVAES